MVHASDTRIIDKIIKSLVTRTNLREHIYYRLLICDVNHKVLVTRMIQIAFLTTTTNNSMT
ncbi:hypothetical protein NS274_12830 [Pseudomonas oryzihabitans]|nr:hypothetical protein NS274_12830 [Pseudomonas psychrotolerans]